EFPQVRRAAIALAREVERRAPQLVTTAWWKEERHGVFVDYNQNARDRTVASAYSVRPNEEGRVSCPLDWDEVADVEPAALTMATVPARLAERGDPFARLYDRAHDIRPLLDLADADDAAGIEDAPWPPHFAKQPNEGRRAPHRVESEPAEDPGGD
ncbi:MAG: ATP-dependent DNA ligase, partial [Acidimicrobiales bacterium]